MESSRGGPRSVVLLGSTGSIGTQAADVIRRNPGRFKIAGLAAGGGNPGLLASQAIEFGAEVVAVEREQAAAAVSEALHAQGAGPHPKESLIAGGPLVAGLAQPGQIVPVDSEHSAIAQCLRAGSAGEVAKLVLTASGGPFLHRSRAELQQVTPEQALAHPTWNMGPVITVNSATLINKGLEVIEAHLLFGIGFEAIEVVVHRQSVVHSMVEFTDGSTIAQASPPDMRIPIALALGWPDRVAGAAPAVDWSTAHTWTFEPLDEQAFPAVRIAREAGSTGGTAPATYNAANEVCVDAFLAGRLAFTGIVDIVAQVVSEHDGRAGDTAQLADVLAADGWARDRARELTSKQPSRVQDAMDVAYRRGDSAG